MPIQSTDTVTSTNSQSEQKTKQNESTDSSFADSLKQSNESKEVLEYRKSTQELIDDLLSMIRTGLTVSEIELLQELLAKLNKLKNKNGDDSETDQEIKNMLSHLEATVLELQKRLKGASVSEQDENDKKSENYDSIESRIKAVTESINEIIGVNISGDKLLKDLLNDIDPSLLQKLESSRFKLDKSEYTTDEQFNNLVEKLNLEHMQKEDKELFKSIIEDRYISDDEVKDLSYEQMETLGKFIFIKEGKYGYVKESLINTDPKAGTLLSIPIITDDKNFNKSVFEIVEKMDDKYEIQQFMWPITGTPHSSQLIAFPEIQANHYNGKDMGKVLDDLLSNYKTRLDNSTRANVMQYFQTKIAQFTDLLNLYNEISENGKEKIENEKYLLDIKFDLVEDLLSMIKTGFTVSEMESLERIISEINKLIDDSKDDKVSKEKIEDMISKLEAEIAKLQDRLNIEITPTEDNTNENSDTENLTNVMKEFKSIVKSLENVLDQIKEESTKLIKSVNTDDELRLREKLKK